MSLLLEPMVRSSGNYLYYFILVFAIYMYLYLHQLIFHAIYLGTYVHLRMYKTQSCERMLDMIQLQLSINEFLNSFFETLMINMLQVVGEFKPRFSCHWQPHNNIDHKDTSNEGFQDFVVRNEQRFSMLGYILSFHPYQALCSCACRLLSCRNQVSSLSHHRENNEQSQKSIKDICMLVDQQYY